MQYLHLREGLAVLGHAAKHARHRRQHGVDGAAGGGEGHHGGDDHRALAEHREDVIEVGQRRGGQGLHRQVAAGADAEHHEQGEGDGQREHHRTRDVALRAAYFANQRADELGAHQQPHGQGDEAEEAAVENPRPAPVHVRHEARRRRLGQPAHGAHAHQQQGRHHGEGEDVLHPREHVGAEYVQHRQGDEDTQRHQGGGEDAGEQLVEDRVHQQQLGGQAEHGDYDVAGEHRDDRREVAKGLLRVGGQGAGLGEHQRQLGEALHIALRQDEGHGEGGEEAQAAEAHALQRRHHRALHDHHADADGDHGGEAEALLRRPGAVRGGRHGEAGAIRGILVHCCIPRGWMGISRRCTPTWSR
ncbi:hypothetical protein D3C76_930180 [compost metagenome]